MAIDLEGIKERRAACPAQYGGVLEQRMTLMPRTDIDALVAEVERLREDRAECYQNWNLLCDDWHRLRALLPDEEEAPDDLQPCGHPRSAIVTARDLGGPGTQYCGMCNAEEIDRTGGA